MREYIKVGKYIPATENAPAVFDRELFGQGFIFKDDEAYETGLDKFCYIPELSDKTYTHQDFLDMVDGQEHLADLLFEEVDWQCPESLMEDYYANGEFDDCPKCKKVFACYKKRECPHCHAPYCAE